MHNAFRDGYVPAHRYHVSESLPRLPILTHGTHPENEETVLGKLIDFFTRFWDIAGGCC